jgi:MoxR-like ATPase
MSSNKQQGLSQIKEILRQHAENQFGEEIQALKEIDDKPKPVNWQLSPWAVLQYLLGGKLQNGTQITPKYFGQERLVETAVATLATDRALLLMGVPGTAKTWISEHLSAAISGDSTLLIQGTAGTSEDSIRYGWNYAKLIAEGPSRQALVETPLMKGLEDGKIVRVEELTRIPADVQDTLITILSEKTLPIPELNSEVQASRGFNIIATANDKDKGVNDLSSALQRRFNTVILPLPSTSEEEVKIVQNRVKSIGKTLELPEIPDSAQEIKKIVTIFRELRSGVTEDNKTKLKSPSGTLSPAEAISVATQGLTLATYYGDGSLTSEDLAASLTGAIIKDRIQDTVVLQEYLETVVKNRPEWKDLYRACKEVIK